MPTVTLRLAPRPAHVRTARLVASAMARRSGVVEDVLDDVRLAVGEACARAVRLHEQQGLDAPVVLEITDDGAFGVDVLDRATAPEPTGAAGQAGEADPTAPDDIRWFESERLGLAVLEGVVDDLAVEHGEGGTRVRMRWPTEP